MNHIPLTQMSHSKILRDKKHDAWIAVKKKKTSKGRRNKAGYRQEKCISLVLCIQVLLLVQEMLGK